MQARSRSTRTQEVQSNQSSNKVSIFPPEGAHFAETIENKTDTMLKYVRTYSHLSLHGECLTGYNEFLSVAARWPHAARTCTPTPGK
jgi:hypothetical protein